MKPYWPLKIYAIAMMLLLITPMTNADDWSGHIGVFAGLKTMNSSDWPDIENHNALGVMFDIKKDSWPVSIALDFIDTGGKSEHDGMTDLGHTTEIQLGVRKIFLKQDSKILPYIGGGVSFMYAQQEYEVNNITTTEDDGAVGAWIGAGMYYEINPSFVLGLDARYSYGKVTLFNEERDAGGLFAGITGGYQF